MISKAADVSAGAKRCRVAVHLLRAQTMWELKTFVVSFTDHTALSRKANLQVVIWRLQQPFKCVAEAVILVLQPCMQLVLRR